MSSKRSVWIALGGLIALGFTALVVRENTIANVAVGGVVTALGFLIGTKE